MSRHRESHRERAPREPALLSGKRPDGAVRHVLRRGLRLEVLTGSTLDEHGHELTNPRLLEGRVLGAHDPLDSPPADHSVGTAHATTGPYAWVRQPQYAGFLAIMVGFLLQWPTLPTLVMFPVLVVIYRRLAIAEEHTVRATFGPAWDLYAATTPRFIPRPSSRPDRLPRAAGRHQGQGETMNPVETAVVTVLARRSRGRLRLALATGWPLRSSGRRRFPVRPR